MPGVTCWRKAVAIQKVGIYIPGGSAPLFSTVLMLGIPAKLAGCEEVILCTPPDQDGKINAAIIYAAQLQASQKFIKLAERRRSQRWRMEQKQFRKFIKSLVPGNQYVTKAKQLVNQHGIAIDMPAGPSEVLVFADETADPAFVAADLLSQAEHGEDSQVMLVVTDEKIIATVKAEIEKQLSLLPRKNIAEKSLQHSKTICFDTIGTAIDFINEYAPEHLIINTREADERQTKS
jgi:histidinol dehydrogenase